MIRASLRLIITLIIVGSLGILAALWRQGRLVIFFTPAHSALPVSNQIAPSHQQASLHYFQERWHAQEVKMVWHAQEAVRASTLITQLCQLMLAEHMITKQVVVSSAFTDPNGKYLYVNCNHSPLPKHAGIAAKIAIMRSIAATIGHNCPAITAFYILVNHEPIAEQDLNLSLPWPVERT